MTASACCGKSSKVSEVRSLVTTVAILVGLLITAGTTFYDENTRIDSL